MSPFHVLVVTPSSGMCRIQYTASLVNLMMYFQRNAIYPECDEQSITFKYWEGTGVSQNRETAIGELLQGEYSHLLFIDDDMGFNPNVLHILAGRRVPIVGCNYRVRRPPARFMATRDTKEIVTSKESTGLEAVDFMGMGMSLFHREVFEVVKPPRFLLKWLQPDPNKSGFYSTEDSVFFKKAAEVGYPIYVDHDASKLIWHNGNIAYTWADDFSNINTIFK